MSDHNQRDNDYFRERDNDRVSRYLGLVGAGVAGIILLGLAFAFFSSNDEPQKAQQQTVPAVPDKRPELRMLDDDALAKMMMQPSGSARKNQGNEDPDDISSGSRFGSIIECPSCPELTVVEPSQFVMGLRREIAAQEKVSSIHGTAELPAHGVTIAKAFGIGTYEVTKQQFSQFAEETGYAPKGCSVQDPNTGFWSHDPEKSWRDPGFAQSPTHPVVCVSYDDAIGYINWLNDKTNGRYRLPSETEWEFAARAGSTAARFWGPDKSRACRYANIPGTRRAEKHTWRHEMSIFDCEDAFLQTGPTGTFKPNSFGLHDMLGGVQEWTEDCWVKNYVGVPTSGEPRLDGDCERRVLRGGSWDDAPNSVRAGRRVDRPLESRKSTYGFRVARDLKIVTPQKK